VITKSDYSCPVPGANGTELPNGTRPGHIEIQETLAKIVDAAQSDVATQLGSLEETVLTLAEALLRPHAPQIPAPREASREGSRDGSREGSREGSRI
jgi:hypothetical protein